MDELETSAYPSGLSCISLFWLISALLVGVIHVLLNSGVGLPHFLKKAYLWGKLRTRERKRDNTGILSFTLNIPKRWFLHFYAFGLTVHICVLILLAVAVRSEQMLELFTPALDVLRWPLPASSTDSDGISSWALVLVLSLEGVQMARRLYECLFISSFSNGSMSIVHYFFGMILYSSFGVSLLSFADLKAFTLHEPLPSADRPWIFTAVCLFVVSSIFQHKSMLTLSRLRIKEKDKPQGHYIPRGHLFDLISCPHYLTEMLIYLSLCLLTRFQSTFLCCVALFVWVNQICASLLVHRWYTNTFPKYPSQRFAVIPFIL